LEALRFGPLTDRTVHLCIDMQNLFALETPWHTPWMARVLPVVTRIAERHPARTVFSRFIPPERPDQMPGRWQRYYEHWRDLTRERIDPELLELVPPLRALVPPAEIIDKRIYSPFLEPDLPTLLRRRGAESLVISGAKRTCAFWPPCLARSILAIGLSSRLTRFAAHPTRPTMRCSPFIAAVLRSRSRLPTAKRLWRTGIKPTVPEFSAKQ